MPLMRRNMAIRRSRAAGLARLAGGLALPVLALGVVGMRIGLVPQPALQPVLVAGFVLGLAALGLAIYSLIDIWISGAEGAGSAVVGILYASPVLVVLGLVAAAALAYPRITDVVTDVNDPPKFSGAHAPHHLPDAESIALQVAAYPNVTPKLYPLPLGDVFVAARKIMDKSGWTVTREVRPKLLPMATSRTASTPAVSEDDELTQALAAKSVMTQSRGGMATETRPTTDPSDADTEVSEPEPTNEATIEATARTAVFGFIDDVVIRLKVNDDGSTQVDMRSASRFGQHDLGENARRIRSFFAKLDAVLQPESAPGAAGLASAGQ